MQSSRKLTSLVKTLSLSANRHPKATFLGHSYNYKQLAKTDYDSHHAKTKHQHTRKGVVAMYVGKELKRYEVPVGYLNYWKFQELLKLSQEDEEFDYIIDGAIRLTCTTEIFDQVLLECAKAKRFI